MDFRVPFKSGYNCFPVLIQLNGQWLYAFVPSVGCSSAWQTEIRSAITSRRDLPGDRCLPAKYPYGAVQPDGIPADTVNNRRVVSDPSYRTPGAAGASNDIFRRIIKDALFRTV